MGKTGSNRGFSPSKGHFAKLVGIMHMCCTGWDNIVCIFIHSGHFYSALSSPLLLRGAPDYSTDTVSEFTRRSAQATAGKGLAQGPYVAARAGVEPTTLRLKVIVSTKAPLRPTIIIATSSCLLLLQRSWHLYYQNSSLEGIKVEIFRQ